MRSLLPRVFGLVAGLAAPFCADAATLTLAPTVEVLEVAPGETATYRLRASASGNVAVRYFAWDYWYDRDNRRHVAPPGTAPRSATAWIAITPSDSVLEAGSRDEPLVSVSVPPDASGAYFSMLFVQTSVPTVTTEGEVATTKARVGSALIVRVKGTLEPALEVGRATFIPPTATSRAQIDLTLHNTGNSDEQPEFRGLLRRTDGEVMGRLSDAHKGRLLPGERGVLSMAWSIAMEPGAYELAGTVLYGDDQAIPLVLPIVVDQRSEVLSPPH